MSLVAAADLPGADAYLAGRHAEAKGQYADALTVYATCQSTDAILAPYARVRAAFCRAAAGDAEGAVADFQAIIAEAPDAPWGRMAKALLAFHWASRDRHEDAAPLYTEILSIEPKRWWLDRYRWLAADNFLGRPASASQGYAFFREVLQTTRRRDQRIQAAQRMAGAPSPEDRFLAAAALIRSAQYREAAAVLVGLAPALLAGGDDQARWNCLMGRVLAYSGREADGRALLQQALDAQPSGVWGRLALAHLARSYISRDEFEAGQAAFDRLVKDYPNTEETGDALWWYAERLADAGTLRDAAAQYRRLVDTCPSHERADDALLAGGRVLAGLGETQAALAQFAEVIDKHPDSPLVAEACYRSGSVRVQTGDTKGALPDFARAAVGGLGNYYAHRAYERAFELGDANAAACPNLHVDSQASFVRPLAVAPGAVAELPAELRGDPRLQRVLFFATHGFEEAEWEALGLSDALQRSDATARALYQFLGEAGLAYTAMELADSFNFEATDGKPSLLRQRIAYPRAYWPELVRLGKETGVDPYLLAAVARQESTFRPGLTSSAGAAGVMQVMPATAKWLAKAEPSIDPESAENLTDPVHSLRLGAYYLMQMLERSDGNVVYALAAYNAGPGNLSKWLKANPGQDLDAFIEGIPFRETRDYVQRVLGNYAAYHTLYGD